MDGLVGPIHGFFLFFYFIYRGGHDNRLGKSLIYRDLSANAVAKTTSANAFCPPLLRFFSSVASSITFDCIRFLISHIAFYIFHEMSHDIFLPKILFL